MSDPTTSRYFYGEGSRRKSGASTVRVSPDGRLGGASYSQGNEIRDIVGDRSMLPIIGRHEYRTVVLHRIDNPGTSTNRTIFDIEDFQANPYFLDTAKLAKSKYTSSVQNVAPTKDNVTGFLLPDGTQLQDPDETIKNIFFDSIKPIHDAAGIVDYSGHVQIPEDYQNYFNGYTYVILIMSEKPKLHVVFPDGGIQQVQDMTLKLYVYGDNQDHDPATPYTDLQKFDAIEFVRSSAPLGMFPETSKSTSYTTENIYNGIIEPFNIRDQIYGKEIFAADDPQKPGSAWGHVTDPIEFSYSADETTKGAFAMHEDVAVAHDADGFFEEKYVSETYFRPDAYSDRDTYDSVYVDEELENVLISMDRTLDEGNLSVRYIDMTVGFDGLAKDRFGSLVYRGLLR